MTIYRKKLDVSYLDNTPPQVDQEDLNAVEQLRQRKGDEWANAELAELRAVAAQGQDPADPTLEVLATAARTGRALTEAGAANLASIGELVLTLLAKEPAPITKEDVGKTTKQPLYTDVIDKHVRVVYEQLKAGGDAWTWQRFADLCHDGTMKAQGKLLVSTEIWDKIQSIAKANSAANLERENKAILGKYKTEAKLDISTEAEITDEIRSAYRSFQAAKRAKRTTAVAA